MGMSVALAVPVALAPRVACAEGLFDFLFGGLQKQLQQTAPAQANVFADPFGQNQQPAPRAMASGPAFCVRSCDGRYFPLTARRCVAGADVPGVLSGEPDKSLFRQQYRWRVVHNGERYADSENAFGYRKALRADCTCNGRDPAGLAPVDLTLDTSLRPGDVIATASGLVAYSGVKTGAGQTAEFTPIASYPGLTAEVRARLGEMKVAPVSAEMIAPDALLPEASRDVALPTTSMPKIVSTRAKRAEAD